MKVLWLNYSYEGNHVLAILKEPECYDTLKRGLEDIRNCVKRLSHIEVDGEIYNVNCFFRRRLEVLSNSDKD